MTTTSRPCPAGCCPAWSTRTATSASAPHGAVDDATAEEQALADRDAGALLLRDAGSPADTRWVQARDDLPRLVRAGRHIARTRRYIRNFAWEVEPEQLVEQVRLEARAGDGWVKLVGDWIDRDTGDLSPCWPADVLAEAVAAAHEEGARVTAHCFGEESLRDLAAAGTDCVEHACGLEPDTIASFAAQGIAIVPTLVNIDTFPQIAEPAREKFPDYHRHMIDLYERRYATIAAARDAGIPVYVGTDAGGSLPHGLVATEVAAPRARRVHDHRGARRRVLGGPVVAGLARPRGGGGGRPRRLRRRPARGPRRPGRPVARRAARHRPSVQA